MHNRHRGELRPTGEALRFRPRTARPKVLSSITDERHDWVDVLSLGTGGVASLRFGTGTQAVADSRRFASEVLRQWKIQPREADILLVVSELVTNAIQHAAGAADECGWLTVAKKGSTVLCTVADTSQTPPTLLRQQPDDGWGYGLHIVQTVCESWGYTLLPAQGKAVWAVIFTGVP